MCISNLKFSAYICHRCFCFPFICFSDNCPSVCLSLSPFTFFLSFFRSLSLFFSVCASQSAFSLFEFLSPPHLSPLCLSSFLSIFLSFRLQSVFSSVYLPLCLLSNILLSCQSSTPSDLFLFSLSAFLSVYLFICCLSICVPIDVLRHKSLYENTIRECYLVIIRLSVLI